MPRIIIFGDSYSSPVDSNLLSWGNIISNLENYEVINFAHNGASTDYAMFKLSTFLKNNEHRDDDIFVVQFSTPGRLHMNYQLEHPETASAFMQDEDKMSPDHAGHTWYQMSKEHIKWYIANRDWDTIVLQQFSYMHLLKTFAENNPNNTVIILQNGFWKNDSFEIVNFPANMFVPNVNLFKISVDEAFGVDYWEFVQGLPGDLRINHLTIPNRKILAELIVETIETKSIERFTYDRFMKDIIKPIKTWGMYDIYVRTGLIEDTIINVDAWFKHNR